MEDIKISVIIPVYNVERFIAVCATSLFSQTMKGVEYIFVDDASPDNSISILQNILEKYPERLKNVQILTHKQNRGLPAARNSGMAVASGEYIFHCDSDDYVEPTMLELLYTKALKQNADIVWCDFWLTLKNSERLMKQPSYGTSLEATKAMLSGAMKFNVWNKLVRRRLYEKNHISFPDGYDMGEDMTMIMLFAEAKNVAHVPIALYHYVKTNSTAFSQTYSEEHLIQLQYNINRIERFLKKRFEGELDQYVAYLKLDTKYPFLLNCDTYKRSLWKQWYPEANAYIMENKDISFQRRFLQLCAYKNFTLIVHLYAFFFNHIYYGLLHK